MTVTESKALTIGAHVFCRGDAADAGVVTETSWDAVTLAWSNGKLASVHHGICAKLNERRQSRVLCNGGRPNAVINSPRSIEASKEEFHISYKHFKIREMVLPSLFTFAVTAK